MKKSGVPRNSRKHDIQKRKTDICTIRGRKGQSILPSTKAVSKKVDFDWLVDDPDSLSCGYRNR